VEIKTDISQTSQQ